MTYSCKSNTTIGKNKTVKDNTVYYDSANPSNCLDSYSLRSFYYIILFYIIPIIFIIIGLKGILKLNKRIRKLKKLAIYGKLIKGLPYTMVPTGMCVNNSYIMSPEVKYTLDNGTVVSLVGDGRYDHKYGNNDQLVDLLIDPNDYNNYYIDFEISIKK